MKTPKSSPDGMRVKDMTTGEPARLMLAFALPLFIGNIFQQAYNMVDTMVAGYTLGDTAIAAIGATSALYNLIINLSFGLNGGCAIVVTQSFGAHDEKRLKQSIAGMLVLNAGAAVILTTLSLLFLTPLLRFMNTPDAIFQLTRGYISIICAGLTATIGYNLLAAILRSVGNSRTPLVFLIISSVLNIILDLLFVAVFRWGLAGAAMATVAAQAVSAILCAGYMLRHYRAILPGREEFRIPKEMMLELLASGAAMGLMYSVVDIGSVIFQRANNMLGEVIISSQTAARRLISIGMAVLGTISNALATFVGQNWGAGKPERIRSAIRKALVMEVAWSLLACSAAYAFGGVLVRFTTGTEDPEIIRNAAMSLRLHMTFFPALGILLCLRMALQSMGKKLAPIFSSCLELGMKIVAASYLIPRFGFLGTSMTEPITWTIMVLFLAAAYLYLRRELFGESGLSLKTGGAS